MRHGFVSSLILSCILLFTGCGSPGYDQSASGTANSLQISSTVDKANVLLNKWDCADALALLEPLYNSANTTNAIRLATASVYGCYANLKVFNVVLDMSNNSSALSGVGFWPFLAKEFPSTSSPDDRIPAAAENGTDAAIAAISTSAVVATTDWINTTSHNPGSIIISDRVNDANAYLTFISMALMGSLLSRNGNPDSSYDRTAALPWLTADKTVGDGCALAAATLNFYDGVTFMAEVAPASMASIYGSMRDMLKSGLDSACSLGCTVCGGTVSCTSCPLGLRDRSICTGKSTDLYSCAAAGIAYFINNSWAGTP